MSRGAQARLSTAHIMLAQFVAQIDEHEATGAHADRIEALREGRATWESRVAELEAEVAS